MTFMCPPLSPAASASADSDCHQASNPADQIDLEALRQYVPKLHAAFGVTKENAAWIAENTGFIPRTTRRGLDREPYIYGCWPTAE